MVDGGAVVVGVDGSTGSHAAALWAAQEAARRQRPLRVVHAAAPTHLPTMRSLAVAATLDWKAEAEKIAADGAAWTKPWHPALRSFESPGGVDWSFLEPQAAAVLAESVAAARPDFPAVEVTERLVDDQPGEALLDASRGAELLVVGSRGRGGLAGLVLGSVSHGAVHRAHCTVAVVR